MTTQKSKIHEDLIAILRKVEAIGKEKNNAAQGYKFRGIDDMYNFLHPFFKELGVFITSEVLEEKREERASKSGGLLIWSILKVKFIFNAVDSSSVSCITVGEAMDSADKATNKASSAALKYALMQMFLIPTQDLTDADANTPEPTAKKTEIKPAAAPVTAKPAAKNEERPWLSEEQYKKGLERIKNGEKELFKKIAQEYRIKGIWAKELKAAFDGPVTKIETPIKPTEDTSNDLPNLEGKDERYIDLMLTIESSIKDCGDFTDLSRYYKQLPPDSMHDKNVFILFVKNIKKLNDLQNFWHQIAEADRGRPEISKVFGRRRDQLEKLIA